MTYCFHCGHYTAGKPFFCNHCGRSYGVRLCPRLHPNPRHAEICSQCGSPELSTPQPPVPLWRKALAFLVRVFLGGLLALLSLYLFLAILIELLRRTEIQAGLIATAFLLLGCWLMWTLLPNWMRSLIRKAMRRKERRNEH